MSARIDPKHGTETTVADHTSAKVKLTGGSAPMEPMGAPSPGRTVVEQILARKRFSQPKGSKAVPVAWHPVMDALALALHTRPDWLRSYSWADGQVSINGQLHGLGTARALVAEELAMLGHTAKASAAPKRAPKPQPVAPKTEKPTAAVVEPVAAPRADLPSDVAEWLERLVFAAKRDYAEAYARHRCQGFPAPADPGTEWAHKARRGVDRLV